MKTDELLEKCAKLGIELSEAVSELIRRRKNKKRRDAFAMAVLPGLLRPNIESEAATNAAIRAYAIADVMLAAREINEDVDDR